MVLLQLRTRSCVRRFLTAHSQTVPQPNSVHPKYSKLHAKDLFGVLTLLVAVRITGVLLVQHSSFASFSILGLPLSSISGILGSSQQRRALPYVASEIQLRTNSQTKRECHFRTPYRTIPSHFIQAPINPHRGTCSPDNTRTSLQGGTTNGSFYMGRPQPSTQ